MSESLKKSRICKIISRSGYCSRRQAEKLIEEEEVFFDGKVVDHPSFSIFNNDACRITIKGCKIPQINKSQVWLYHKPENLLVSRVDELNKREVIFDHLPNDVPKITVGRLDYKTEGLIILTNDGEVARFYELPENSLKRTYKVKLFGRFTNSQLNHMLGKITKGVEIDSIQYGRSEVKIISQTLSQIWLEISIFEGKNREIRKIFEFFGWKVSRLIRVSYGEFELGDLQKGQLKGPIDV